MLPIAFHSLVFPAAVSAIALLRWRTLGSGRLEHEPWDDGVQ